MSSKYVRMSVSQYVSQYVSISFQLSYQNKSCSECLEQLTFTAAASRAAKEPALVLKENGVFVHLQDVEMLRI